MFMVFHIHWLFIVCLLYFTYTDSVLYVYDISHTLTVHCMFMIFNIHWLCIGCLWYFTYTDSVLHVYGISHTLTLYFMFIIFHIHWLCIVCLWYFTYTDSVLHVYDISHTLTLLQDNVKRLLEIQSSLIGQCELVRPGRVRSNLIIPQRPALVIKMFKCNVQWNSSFEAIRNVAFQEG